MLTWWRDRHGVLTPRSLQRELTCDAVLRRAIFVALTLAAAVLLWSGRVDGVVHVLGTPVSATLLAVLVVVLPWLPVNIANAKAARALAQAATQMEQDPAAAEATLRAALRRWPLRRWTRLMLYQRMGVVRHRQRRFGESAALAAAVLTEGVDRRMGPHARGGLLLQLTEAALAAGDVAWAYAGLAELHGMKLPLPERVQRMMLQCRYERAVGAWDHLAWNWRGKAKLAELLPAALSAQAHALLAEATRRSGRRDAARWLTRRARLLGGRG